MADSGSPPSLTDRLSRLSPIRAGELGAPGQSAQKSRHSAKEPRASDTDLGNLVRRRRCDDLADEASRVSLNSISAICGVGRGQESTGDSVAIPRADGAQRTRPIECRASWEQCRQSGKGCVRDGAQQEGPRSCLLGLFTLKVWLARKDSNLQSPDPESGALPLGHSPASRVILPD